MKLNTILLLLLLTNSLFAQKAKIEFLPNLPYDKYELKTNQDTTTFYLSVTSSKSNLPLIVYVQGSGMNSLFTKYQNGQIRPEYGHMTWYNAGQEKYRILVVEKPGVKYLQSGPSKNFDTKFSLESFSNSIVNAINYTTQNEKIDTTKILIAGHSEGGIVASRVANLMKNKISNVAVMAGEGLSQLYSLYKFADDGTFFSTKEHNMPTSEQRIKYLTDKWKDILANPNSTDKMFWGFTYLRWSSMLKTSVIDELANYNGKILIIQGTSDKAVHPENAISSYTALLSKGKQVELKVIEKADHSFNISDKPDIDGWKSAIEDIIKWFN
ncbi:alpha/beta hydrolase family protein [Paenimyroides baculatum]|uniref:Alpha/beta fold hydrolase n=1 Tax=Paenimyroides baculatum TaxID=2608000 RepID=A0A5M6CL47_9FLAO|nr:alpha/beta fold hydrolase [Paenimyroides baculatum]KAA5535793.1 alpha/beta fold hydrolase [Paenimyroides baculatum]